MTFENNYKSIINFIDNNEIIRENFNKMVAAYELNCFLNTVYNVKDKNGEKIEVCLYNYLNENEIEMLFRETYDSYIFSPNASPAECAVSTICDHLEGELKGKYKNYTVDYFEGENEHEIFIEYLKEAYKDKKEDK